jgi:hypothetical protein
MSFPKCFFLLGSVLLLATLLVTFSPKAPSAHAASVNAPAQAASPMVTCYGGATLYGPFSLQTNTIYLWPGAAPTRCADINIKFTELTAPMQMQVRFIHTGQCNSRKTVSSTGVW